MKERKIMFEHMNFVADYIRKISTELDYEKVNKLINEIIDTKRIFLMGAGRSGLEASAFAMRLMHLGFDVHVIGEVTTPVPGKEDLVIMISGSGKTPSIVELGTAIKSKGAKMVIITMNNSIISDIAIVIPVIINDIDKDLREGLLPMGTLFEVVSHIILDGLISELKHRKGVTEAMMKDRHMLSEYVGIL